jgi:hypothetical protein
MFSARTQQSASGSQPVGPSRHPTPASLKDDLRRQALRNMAVGRSSEVIDWANEIPGWGDDSGGMFDDGEVVNLGLNLDSGEVEGVGKEVDSDDESADSWSAMLGELEQTRGKGEPKAKKSKGKGKEKASKKKGKGKGKGKGKEQEKKTTTPVITEYERTKLANIAKNAAAMEELRIDWEEMGHEFAKPRPKATPRVRKDKNLPPALPERRSIRNAG